MTTIAHKERLQEYLSKQDLKGVADNTDKMRSLVLDVLNEFYMPVNFFTFDGVHKQVSLLIK